MVYQVTTSDNKWQRVTMSGAKSDNEWQQVTTSDKEWQQMAIIDSEYHSMYHSSVFL